MKNTTKASLVVALVMILLGGSLAAVGILNGGGDDAKKMMEENNIELFTFPSDKIVDIGFDNNQKVTDKDCADQFLANDIENLSISIGGAEVIINDSEDEYIYVNISNMSASQVYAENNTLYINSKNKKIGTGSVILSIPASAYFQEVNLEVGASSFEGTSFECRSLTMSLGAGEAVIKSLTVADDADIDLGAGDFTIESGKLNNLDIELGLGNLEFNGIISGNLDAECGMGNATFNFKDSAINHSFDLEADMGNISINGEDFGRFNSHRNQDNNTNSVYDIECGMGNIEINFAN